MDLSKAFDSLPHGLLLAKLKAYGFSDSSLSLLQSYLSNRYQRTKVGTAFSEWLRVLLGVPQGSILGPLLFNIFINDIFLFVERSDICNFADDNTLYNCGKTIDSIINPLKRDVGTLLMWFRSNQLGANPDKFQLMFLGLPKCDQFDLLIQGVCIKPSDYVKLLGITIDNKLNFDLHINNLCTSANRKINCLYRIRNYLNLNQMKTLANAYIMCLGQRLYHVLFQICAGNKIKRTHKRCLKMIYESNSDISNCDLEQLLQLDSSTHVHVTHL